MIMGNRALAVAKSREDSVTGQGNRRGLRNGNLTITEERKVQCKWPCNPISLLTPARSRGCSAGRWPGPAGSCGLWEDEHHRLSWTAGDGTDWAGDSRILHWGDYF